MKYLFAIFGAALVIVSTSVIQCTPSDKDSNSNIPKVSVTIPEHEDTTTVYLNSTANLKSRFIPSQVFEMKNLRELTVRGMDCDYGDTTTCWMIREIPRQIGKLTKLEALQLNLNAIQTIPEEIMELKELKTLDLTDNPALSNIDNIVALTNLEELYLFGCNLYKLPKGIGELKKLRHLGLTGNNLDRTELDRIKNALPTCDVTF